MQEVPAQPETTAASAPTTDADAATSGEGQPQGHELDIPISDTSLEQAQQEWAGQSDIAPTRLIYPRIRLDMPVDPVTVAADGQMEVPDDALRAGWYAYGPGFGASQGTTVIAAHSGSFITPRGPFYDLRDAAIGDEVTIAGPDDATLTYVVTNVESIGKEVIELGQYFARDGEHSLVLITCGGSWDESAQSYRNNIVVTASLV